MDGGNGWPAPGFAGGPHDATIMNRIMLRFRPIAPKPASAGSSPGSTVEGKDTELLQKQRVKRKYVKVKKRSNKCKNSTNKEEKVGFQQLDDGENTVITLQLMPESSFSNEKTCLGNRSENSGCLTVGSMDRVDRRVVESWLMVDKMTNTLVDGEGIGSTDMEKMKNLEADTCPGLISDGSGRVQWVNLAYRRLVNPLEGSGTPLKLVTWLVMEEEILLSVSSLPAFACTVRIIYNYRSTRYSQTMPCDVWKMDFGGFAWRLDAKAALCLGR